MLWGNLYQNPTLERSGGQEERSTLHYSPTLERSRGQEERPTLHHYKRTNIPANRGTVYEPSLTLKGEKANSDLTFGECLAGPTPVLSKGFL